MSKIVDTTDGEVTICSCHDDEMPFDKVAPVCREWQGIGRGDRCIRCGHWEVCHIGPRQKLSEFKTGGSL